MTHSRWLLALGFCLLLPASLHAGEPEPVTAAKKEAKERRDTFKEKFNKKKEEIKDKREDAKEKRQDAREDAKDSTAALRERWQKLKETRRERRQERRDQIIKRWGKIEKKPAVRSELKVHAWRMARLKRLRAIAESNDKKDTVARIDKLTQKEDERHDKRMAALEAKGGEQ